ncbi:iron-sulfur cluster assembly scaffold protein, partial [Candidatus Dojkabacteria bacterium]|nr:iron-sulfur cluster assembly scaffold protein [Candidatus Dojkabacteria bacterium]
SGCAISIASASILSDELLGKSITEISQLEDSYVGGILGIELTTSRRKCARLPLQAIQQAANANGAAEPTPNP